MMAAAVIYLAGVGVVWAFALCQLIRKQNENWAASPDQPRVSDRAAMVGVATVFAVVWPAWLVSVAWRHARRRSA